MSNTNKISSIFKVLFSAKNEEFKDYLDQYFEKTIGIIGSIDEFQENFFDYDDIYEIYITDIDFQCWVRIKKGKITYGKGVKKNSDIKFKLTKDLLLKIVKLEIQPYDAYMRGLIKKDGPLRYALRFRNFLNEFIQYFSYFLQKSTK